MTVVRLPDLWLKIDMALAIVPPGTPMDYIQNGALARCVRGDSAQAATFNQWMAGDNALRLADDVHFLAATLEYLIIQGNELNLQTNAQWDHNVIREYARRHPNMRLEAPIVGTFIEFAAALLDLVKDRADYEASGGTRYFEAILEGIVRKALLETLPGYADHGGQVDILHGKTRHWLERLARKRPDEFPSVPEKDFIQFAAPAASLDRTTLGFELRTDASLIAATWQDIAGWFAPRFQRRDMAAFVLEEAADDTEAWQAEVLGQFGVYVYAIVYSGEDEGLPLDLYKLTIKHPSDWPSGYAETMALFTYLKRLSGKAIRAENANAREFSYRAANPEAAGDKLTPIPARAQLYKGNYRVIDRVI